MLEKALFTPWSSRFVRDVKAAGRPVFHWTANEDDFMRWSIKHGADGVITDNPKRFLEYHDLFSAVIADVSGESSVNMHHPALGSSSNTIEAAFPKATSAND
ncbi:MAG: hypothetical protein Q9202_004436 [Teloschistes flavicans]